MSDRENEMGAEAGRSSEVQMVRLEERLAATSRDVQGLERLFKDGMTQIAAAIDKQATAFNTSFESAKQQFVAKAELEAMKVLWGQKVAELERENKFIRGIVLGFCGLVLLTVVGAMLAKVIIK